MILISTTHAQRCSQSGKVNQLLLPSINDLLDLEANRVMEMIRNITVVKPMNDSDINALGVEALEWLCEDLVPSFVLQEEDVDTVSEGYTPPTK